MHLRRAEHLAMRKTSRGRSSEKTTKFARYAFVLFVMLMAILVPASQASASAAGQTKGENQSQTVGPKVVVPLEASGCTYATAVIKICIDVHGSGNEVTTVDDSKQYLIGYVNACDTPILYVNGSAYAVGGLDCSPVGSYLKHTFNVYESFASGTSVCVSWQSYSTHRPCETVN